MKLIFRVIVCLSLFLLLACSQSNNTVAVGDTLSNRYAYVMQNKEVGSRWRPFLTQIDLASGEILNEIQVNYPYSYLTLLDNGDVLLTYSRDAKSLKRRVDKYSVKDNKVRSYIKTKAYYPSVVIPYNDQEFVLLDAHSSGDLLFEVFDEKGKYKQSLPIHNQSMCIYGSAISVEGNGNVWLFLDDFSDIEHDSIPVLLSLNLNTLKVKNITTDFMKDISSIDAAVFNVSGNSPT